MRPIAKFYTALLFLFLFAPILIMLVFSFNGGNSLSVLDGFSLEILDTHPVEYRCYCSRERVTRALISMGREELNSLIREQGRAELTCQFCDRIHSFSGEELRRMIDELKKIGK